MSTSLFRGLVRFNHEVDMTRFILSKFECVGNNDSWLEVYKISKEQWKSEIVAHQQVSSMIVGVRMMLTEGS